MVEYTNRLRFNTNNQSTRLQVLQAMKATIESAGLGLTRRSRLMAEASRQSSLHHNVDNAPSLALTGVPGGAIPISFVQDQSFTAEEMRNAIISGNQQSQCGWFVRV